MPHKDANDRKLAHWRSTFRGYIWLSAPIPFLYTCAGYLTSNLKTVCRLIAASFLMLYLFIMYRRHDEIVQNMKQRGSFSPAFKMKRLLICLGLLAMAGVLYGVMLIPIIPLFIRGMIATGYYLALMVCWYQSINEPRRKCDEK